MEVVGKTFWRELLAKDLATARRLLPARIAATDALIERLRAAPPVRPTREVISPEVRSRLLHGRPAAEIFHDPSFWGGPDDAEQLASLPPVEIAGSAVVGFDELIDLGSRLKQPHAQTVVAWKRAVDELAGFAGVEANLIDRETAQAFRDHLMKRGLKISTIKTRIHYIKGLFNLGVEEGLLERNPFTGVIKRLSASPGQRSEVDIVYADVHAKELGNEYLIYNLLRWTGCRLAEILGLESSDIDLDARVINIKGKPDRPLKTTHSERVIPIHCRLDGVIETKVDGPSRPFYKYFDSLLQEPR